MSPTPYPDVNAILARLLADQRALLGPDLVGLYLFGSLSWGDFDPVSSDIDFLAVTAGELSPASLDALRELHARLAASGLPWADRLEGSYIPRAALRRHDPANARFATIGVDWPFGLAQHGSQWVIERHIVRERGVTLWGPPPATLIDPVSPADLRGAVRDALRDSWARRVEQPDWLGTRRYQAFAILTLCRALYTLERGGVASKPDAAAWARATLPARWTAAIDRALAWRHDPEAEDPTETLAFLRYALGRAASQR